MCDLKGAWPLVLYHTQKDVISAKQSLASERKMAEQARRSGTWKTPSS